MPYQAVHDPGCRTGLSAFSRRNGATERATWLAPSRDLGSFLRRKGEAMYRYGPVGLIVIILLILLLLYLVGVI
ncbi:MAG TPA: hypothetical protein VFD32_23650 [Dehalococcoidia bacterium]|nr:hypothetical protein [Dehalococcoidia bacterium]